MGIVETVKAVAREQGHLEKNTEFVTNLIEQTDFNDDKIASLASVALDFVKNIRTQLSKKKK